MAEETKYVRILSIPDEPNTYNKGTIGLVYPVVQSGENSDFYEIVGMEYYIKKEDCEPVSIYPQGNQHRITNASDVPWAQLVSMWEQAVKQCGRTDQGPVREWIDIAEVYRVEIARRLRAGADYVNNKGI